MDTRHRPVIIVVIILLIALVGFGIYSATSRTAPVSIPVPAPSGTTTPVTSFTPPNVDVSSWKTYSDQTLGFTVKYPPDAVLNQSMYLNGSSAPQDVTFWFPAKDYFSTVLQDDAVVGISASSTCQAMQDAGPIGSAPVVVSVNGLQFTMTVSNDAAAGNRYQTIAYDVMHGGACYRVAFFDHGANGAGLYEGDPAKIAADDAAHDAELAHVTDIFGAMLDTFSFTK